MVVVHKDLSIEKGRKPENLNPINPKPYTLRDSAFFEGRRFPRTVRQRTGLREGPLDTDSAESLGDHPVRRKQVMRAFGVWGLRFGLGFRV